MTRLGTGIIARRHPCDTGSGEASRDLLGLRDAALAERRIGKLEDAAGAERCFTVAHEMDLHERRAYRIDRGHRRAEGRRPQRTRDMRT